MSRIILPKANWNERSRIWRVDVRYKGRKKALYSKIENERKALADLKSKYADWMDAVDVGSGEMSPVVKSAWAEFIADYERKNKITSTKKIDSRGQAHILKRFAYRDVDKMTKHDWQSIINNAYDAKAKSFHTLKGIENTIRSFTRYCAARGWIKDNAVPLYFVNPADRRAVPEKRILQPNQFIELVTDDSGDWYVPMFQFLALTGIRRGELCALQAERDYIDGIITVRESVSHDHDWTDGKTKNASRSFAPLALALDAINRHHAQRAARGITDSRWLFCDKHGDYVSPRTLGNHWRRWRDAHGIEITLHELRHTFISYTRNLVGLDLAAVKSLVGHSARMDTERTYAHAIEKTPEDIERERQIMMKHASQIDATMEMLINAAHVTAHME